MFLLFESGVVSQLNREVRITLTNYVHDTDYIHFNNMPR